MLSVTLLTPQGLTLPFPLVGHKHLLRRALLCFFFISLPESLKSSFEQKMYGILLQLESNHGDLKAGVISEISHQKVPHS